MSQYISQQAQVTAQCAAQAAATLSATLEQAELVQRAAQLRAAGATAALGELVAERSTELQEVALRIAPEAVGDLGTIVAAAADRLQIARTDLIVDAALEATTTSSFGFDAVQVTRADDVVTILGTAGHSALMVRVDRATGDIDRDWQVGPGDRCVGLDAEWTDVLDRRGIHTVTTHVDTHEGRRDGARLIAPATALSPASPTVGGVLGFRKEREARTLRSTAGGAAATQHEAAR